MPLINGDTEEAIESVSVDWVSILLKRVEFRENVRAFFRLGQNKLSIIKRCLHRRTGNFLPGGAVNLLPKKFSQVARILPKRTVEKKRGPHDATTEAALVYEGGPIL